MLDKACWAHAVCDECYNNDAECVDRLHKSGVLKDNQWNGGYSLEKGKYAAKIRKECVESIKCLCLIFETYEDKVTLCEKHLQEVLDKKPSI